ncbi:HNH endonuclease [Streptomyces sp. NBC_00656]|uniref:HNH endonuclease n=1 Tax=Streptomyces sp. NBC_00656 TaxID=2903668 RepID=UPI0032493F11
MTKPRYTSELLTQKAAEANSLVDLMRRLDAPLTKSALRYLRIRLKHYGVDCSHFANDELPSRAPRTYTRAILSEAAANSHSISEMLDYMEVAPYDSLYSHIARRLEAFRIDVTHFSRPVNRRCDQFFPREELSKAVSESQSMAGVMRAMGLHPSNGAGRAKARRSIAAYGLSTDHFVGQGHNSGRPSLSRKTSAEILRRLPPGSPRTKTILLRRALGETGVSPSCNECGLGNLWQGQRLVLEIDHINGDRLDNRLQNLRYLCPSCHSQTATFSNRTRPVTQRR